MVIIDQPELVVSSILQLVNQQRNTRSLNAIGPGDPLGPRTAAR